MIQYEDPAVWLKLMGHPVRLQILNMLRAGEICVCHIEHTLNRRQAYISQQLMVLRDAGLVQSRKDGLQVYYRLANNTVEALLSVLFGPPVSPQIQDGCNCPVCLTVFITEIE